LAVTLDLDFFAGGCTFCSPAPRARLRLAVNNEIVHGGKK